MTFKFCELALSTLILFFICSAQILAPNTSLAMVSTAWEIDDGETCTLTILTANGGEVASFDEVSYSYYATRIGHFEQRTLPSEYVLKGSDCTGGGQGSSSCSVDGCATGNPSGCSTTCNEGYACCNCGNIFKAPSCECVVDSDDEEEEEEL